MKRMVMLVCMLVGGLVYAGEKEEAQKKVEVFLERGSYVRVEYYGTKEYYNGDFDYLLKSEVAILRVDKSSESDSYYIWIEAANADLCEICENSDVSLDDKGNLIFKVEKNE